MPTELPLDGLGPDFEKSQVEHDHEEKVKIGRKPASGLGPEKPRGHAAKNHQQEDKIFEVQRGSKSIAHAAVTFSDLCGLGQEYPKQPTFAGRNDF